MRDRLKPLTRKQGFSPTAQLRAILRDKDECIAWYESVHSQLDTERTMGESQR